jgi:hypothetical protein
MMEILECLVMLKATSKCYCRFLVLFLCILPIELAGNRWTEAYRRSKSRGNSSSGSFIFRPTILQWHTVMHGYTSTHSHMHIYDTERTKTPLFYTGQESCPNKERLSVQPQMDQCSLGNSRRILPMGTGYHPHTKKPSYISTIKLTLSIYNFIFACTLHLQPYLIQCTWMPCVL